MVFVISAVLLPFGAAMGQVQGGKSPDEIRGSTTLAEIARDYQVPPSHLIERLKLPPDTSRDEPLKSLKDRHGFQMDAVRGFVSEYRSGRATLPAGGRAGSAGAEREGRGRERKASLTPLILALYGSFCIVMLLLLAKSRVTRPVRMLAAFAAVLVFGIVFRAAAHPFESLVRVFQALGMGRYGLGETLAVFLAFALMAFIGVKLVCGWGCPVGTLQELLYELPYFKGIKKKRTPFWLSNGVRVVLFIAFLILLFGWIPGLRDQSVYRHFNPFKLFEWNFGMTAPVVVLLIFGLSVIRYRFFCMWVCPFGLFSWLTQNFSPYKVRVNHETCIDCGICVRACPTNAAEGIVKGDAISADCFSCGRCLPECKNGSIRYGLRAGAEKGIPGKV
jgi:polyferredoxin